MSQIDRPGFAGGLRVSAVRGGLAIVSARFGIQLVRLGLTAILARLLSPHDYGLVSVCVAFTGLGIVLQDLGLSAPTVQRATITTQQVSLLFWLNALLGLLIAIVGVAVAPLIAAFYQQPEVGAIAATLFAGMLIPSLSVQHRALLQRQMRFTELSSINVKGIVVGGAAALFVAWRGGGAWALITLTLVNDSVVLLASWHASGFRPTRPQWDGESRGMLRFGGGFLLFRLMGYLAQNLHVVLIGRNTGVASAGLYARAQTTGNLLLGYTNEPAGAIAMAALPKHAGAPDAFANFYARCLSVMMLAAAPVALFTWMFASDLIRVLMGPQWDVAAQLLSVLALGMAIQPALNSTGWIYIARAQIKDMVTWGMVGWGVMIGSALLGLRWGIFGVAWAWSIALYVLLLPCLIAAYRGTQIRLGPSLLIVARPLLAAAIAIAATAPLAQLLEGQIAVLRLFCCAALFGLTYLALVWWVFGQRTLIADIVRSLIKSKKPGDAVS